MTVNPLHQNSMNLSFSGYGIDKKIPKSKRSYTDYLKKRNLNSLLLNPLTESEIEEIINMFCEKKAVGLHSIPTNILEKK